MQLDNEQTQSSKVDKRINSEPKSMRCSRDVDSLFQLVVYSIPIFWFGEIGEILSLINGLFFLLAEIYSLRVLVTLFHHWLVGK